MALPGSHTKAFIGCKTFYRRGKKGHSRGYLLVRYMVGFNWGSCVMALKGDLVHFKGLMYCVGLVEMA